MVGGLRDILSVRVVSEGLGILLCLCFRQCSLVDMALSF